MEEDFDTHGASAFFDFKGFVYRILSYWWLFLIVLIISFLIVRSYNNRQIPIYRETNTISIKDDQNPLFTGNTSLVFNWGGTTDKVQTSIILFKSRTHTEKVVDYLQYYINYQKQGEYHIEDVYGYTPFMLDLERNQFQLSGKEIRFTDQGNGSFQVDISFNGTGEVLLTNYTTGEKQKINAPQTDFSKIYKLGDKIDEPFLKGIISTTSILSTTGNIYLVRLDDLDNVVRRYKNINILQRPTGSSILELSLTGTNKKRLINYLNASVDVLIRDQLERKNLFATKTIKFIDSSLTDRNKDLQSVLEELNDFQNKNSGVVLSGGSGIISDQLTTYDTRKDALTQQITYYNQLENYLRTRTDYTKVPAPSVALINEGSISAGVAKIVELAVSRSNLAYTAKEGNPAFRDLDRRIDTEKAILLENIASSKGIINSQVNNVNQSIAQAETQLRKFPKEEQELAEIQRRFTLSQEAYNLYLEKKGEATIIKASNVSDILIIDPAKDVGNGPIGPKTGLNYVLALLVGCIIPFVIVFVLFFFDTKIGALDDVKKRSNIPILGVIGKNTYNSNIIVRDHPRSAISEGFRGLRSSLQFLYRKKGVEGAKSVLVTSSVSGEGKTFNSINLASVFALSKKKTVLVGLDLRKPKIFDDFDINNDKGVVNYLIGDANLDEIKQPSGIEHLDIILSGPIPPNPSELIIGDSMQLFINELKQTYDYIILDTPPLGLVSDAFELMPYADASLYVIRQGYTKKDMLTLVNEKYEKSEIKNISFVLNHFQQKKRYGYGANYGYGYGYGNYNNGYHEEQKRSFVTAIKRFFKKG